MALQNTAWPADLPAPEGVRLWLSALFEIVDSKEPDSGTKLAEMYTGNAVVYGLHGKVQGTKAIIESRKTAWNAIDFRKHEIVQVYAGKSDYSDILLLGKLTAHLKNGNKLVEDFIAQIKFEGDTHSKPKGVLYRVWADSAPWTKALNQK